MEEPNVSDAGVGSPPPPPAQPNDAGRMSTELAEAGKITLKPRFRPTKPDLGMDLSAVDEAAKELGMVQITGRSILAHRRLGEALKEAGAIKVGRAKMLVSAENMQEVFEKMRQLEETIDPTEKPSTKLGVLTAMAQLATAQSRAAYDFVRTAEVDHSDDASGQSGYQPFAPRQPVVLAGQGATVNVGKQNGP